MHRINSLELLGTLIAVLEQKSKYIDFKTKCAEKFLSQSEKLINILFRVKFQYMKEAYFSLN